jgi:type VI secretion system FHA domain protein
MPLRLEIISHHRVRLGERRIREFGIKGGTIGRSLESDWALEDSSRFLSSRHAAIDFRSGTYYIIDTSTNGVFVNDTLTPVGKTKPQRLFEGDRLRMGEYVMRVHIEDDYRDEDDLAETTHIDPVSAAQFTETPMPTGYTLVSEDELSAMAVEDILEDENASDSLKEAAERAALELKLVEDTAERGAQRRKAQAETPKPAPPPAKLQAAAKPRAAKPDRMAAPAELGPDDVGLFAFLKGAGIAPRKLGRKESAAMLHRAGRLMRELAIGLRHGVEQRAKQKKLMRLGTTTIQPQANNFFKFSASVDEALENLFFLEKPEYLSAVEAVREAFDDISSHERALMQAMYAALSEYLDKLDPDEIEQSCDDGGKRGSLLGGSNASKYWNRYSTLYARLAHQPPGQLPPDFLQAFTEAYENALAHKPPAARKPAASSTK